ncbi:N-acetylmuramoyl-L-alanine amidase [Candidatus Bipolaricaulota bacterium]|nr:N-acetylmuramoyl-L-alanine amidase [Candidatus Bipolaricaulota bacterium]
MTMRGIVLIAAVVVIGVAATLVLVFDPFGWGPQPDPAPVYTIAIDAGHGGRDPGATADDVMEKDINLSIAGMLTELVNAQPDMVAVQIRTLDIFISLEDRILKAEEAGAELYVTVHVNSYDTEEPDGAETIVDNTREQDDDSWVLAELIQDGVTEATGARDRGARSQESYLQRTEMPAVSVETGYLTNPAERAKLIDPEYQAKIAQGVLNGIRQFIDWKYPAPTLSGEQ